MSWLPVTPAAAWAMACAIAPSTGRACGLVAIEIVAVRAVSGSALDVAAAEKSFGIVTTASYVPSATPSSACAESVRIQVNDVGFDEPATFSSSVAASGSNAAWPVTSAADSCRPRGTVWPSSSTGSSSFTTAAVIRSSRWVGSHSAQVSRPPTTSGTRTRPTIVSHDVRRGAPTRSARRALIG